MKFEDNIKAIKRSALINQKKRTDLRYLKTMAFMCRKGFLKSDINFSKNYFTKIKYADAVWAGKNVEPRILEVLPAAVTRFRKSFVFMSNDFEKIEDLITTLRKGVDSEIEFYGISFKKIKVWMNLQLQDQRTKTADLKKITKTFRLQKKSLALLKAVSLRKNVTETEIIENLIFRYSG